jgi:hypothetical protein
MRLESKETRSGAEGKGNEQIPRREAMRMQTRETHVCADSEIGIKGRARSSRRRAECCRRGRRKNERSAKGVPCSRLREEHSSDVRRG